MNVINIFLLWNMTPRHSNCMLLRNKEGFLDHWRFRTPCCVLFQIALKWTDPLSTDWKLLFVLLLVITEWQTPHYISRRFNSQVWPRPAVANSWIQNNEGKHSDEKSYKSRVSTQKFLTVSCFKDIHHLNLGYYTLLYIRTNDFLSNFMHALKYNWCTRYMKFWHLSLKINIAYNYARISQYLYEYKFYIICKRI